MYDTKQTAKRKQKLMLWNVIKKGRRTATEGNID
jgi:hypothetical protein